MSFVKDWGPGDVVGKTVTVTLDSTVPVGASLIVIVSIKGAANGFLLPSDTVVDSKGNTYITDKLQDNGTVNGALLAHSVITHELGSSDTVSFTPENTQNRFAMGVSHFTDTITSVDSTDSSFVSGHHVDLSAGTVTTDDAAGLFVAAWYLSNVGRDFTPGSGWTAGNKFVSTNGSGDTATLFQYKYGTGSTSTPGSISSGGETSGVSAGYGLDSVATTLPTPDVSLLKTDPTTAEGTDGEIYSSWPAVPGAGSYGVGKLPGSVTSGAVEDDTTTDLFYTWTGLSAGTTTITVRAKP